MSRGRHTAGRKRKFWEIIAVGSCDHGIFRATLAKPPPCPVTNRAHSFITLGPAIALLVSISGRVIEQGLNPYHHQVTVAEAIVNRDSGPRMSILVDAESLGLDP
jgi:hypothetical protein